MPMQSAAAWRRRPSGLQTTDMPVGRIAGALGYQNASKFSQAFAAFYGVPPTAYKRGYFWIERDFQSGKASFFLLYFLRKG